MNDDTPRWRGRVLPVAILLLFSRYVLDAGAVPATGTIVQNVTVSDAQLRRVERSTRALQLRVTGDFVGEGITTRVFGDDAPRRVHQYALDRLRPGHEYAWELSGVGERVVDEGRFGTPPARDVERVRFVAVGDSGAMPWGCGIERWTWFPARSLASEPAQYGLARSMAAWQADLFLHLGDLAYSRDLPRAGGPSFFEPFAPLFRTAVTQVMPGNHDYHDYESARVVKTMGYADDLEHGIRTSYDFGWGSVRFIVLDSERGRWSSPAAKAWLEARLRHAAEPWVIVALHHPLRSRGGSVRADLVDSLWPILSKHGVDLVLAGHHHAYQRFHPEGGVVQVVAGAGGDSLDQIKPDMALAAHDDSGFGYLAFDVDGVRLIGRYVSADGRLVDRFDMHRADSPDRGSPARRARIQDLISHPWSR